MTLALCLRCGNVKFGAWCACPNCRWKSCGDRKLDIAFSDHFMSERTLERFGEVIKQLQARCDDQGVCFWAFLSFVTRSSYPSILRASPPDDLIARVDSLLAEMTLPQIEIEPGIRGSLDALKDEVSPSKRWWQFWR